MNSKNYSKNNEIKNFHRKQAAVKNKKHAVKTIYRSSLKINEQRKKIKLKITSQTESTIQKDQSIRQNTINYQVQPIELIEPSKSNITCYHSASGRQCRKKTFSPY